MDGRAGGAMKGEEAGAWLDAGQDTMTLERVRI
jgi:hypothetical protein